MMGGGMGMVHGIALAIGFGLWILIELAVLVLIIVAIVWLVRDLKRRSAHQPAQDTPRDAAP
jgi:predicted lipid-binding transport protein (Tim44 family)